MIPTPYRHAGCGELVDIGTLPGPNIPSVPPKCSRHGVISYGAVYHVEEAQSREAAESQRYRVAERETPRPSQSDSIAVAKDNPSPDGPLGSH